MSYRLEVFLKADFISKVHRFHNVKGIQSIFAQTLYLSAYNMDLEINENPSNTIINEICFHEGWYLSSIFTQRHVKNRIGLL